MARKAFSVCAEPGCPELTLDTRCVAHTRIINRNKATRYNDPERRKVYQSRRWRGVRKQVLRDSPYCQVVGCNNPATDVDHIKPLQDQGDPYEVANLQALCKKHHSQKTAKEIWGRK